VLVERSPDSTILKNFPGAKDAGRSRVGRPSSIQKYLSLEGVHLEERRMVEEFVKKRVQTKRGEGVKGNCLSDRS